MLTKDRPEMAARAVRAFRAQTYKNKVLFVMADNPSTTPATDMMRGEFLAILDFSYLPRSIGYLRNLAAKGAMAQFGHGIMIDWDDDDVSHPNRIAEQVAHLQASGADAVGYNELLFWRTPHNEAWIYKNVRANLSPGTSLAFWRKTWERKPFPDTSHGEDRIWQEGLNVAAVSCFQLEEYFEPRLIASIHGGNSEDYGDLEKLAARGDYKSWRRARQWDESCQKRMAL
jgi:hypothetical protein